ncbi:uncharacterized protein [Linepithema humile]|uniref:uncharacterized protein isoform X2 n=1 Tax=Linepithema humile TaxID=83485 RepID=UPI00351E584C
MKQSRLVFQSAKCNEKKISLPNKPTSILPNTEENSISDISLEKVFVTSKSNASSTNETVEDDVVELSPTESRSNRARRLKEKLKRNDINDINDINLCDTENKPPVEILLKKNRKRRKKNIPEQLNMRCKADRAKIDGWDCWECKQIIDILQEFVIDGKKVAETEKSSLASPTQIRETSKYTRSFLESRIS